MQGQKPSGQKVKAHVELPPVPRGSRAELYRPRPARDGSGHYEAKCRACGCTSYLRDGEGVVYTAEQVEKDRAGRKTVPWSCGVCGAAGEVVFSEGIVV